MYTFQKYIPIYINYSTKKLYKKVLKLKPEYTCIERKSYIYKNSIKEGQIYDLLIKAFT